VHDNRQEDRLEYMSELLHLEYCCLLRRRQRERCSLQGRCHSSLKVDRKPQSICARTARDANKREEINHEIFNRMSARRDQGCVAGELYNFVMLFLVLLLSLFNCRPYYTAKSSYCHPYSVDPGLPPGFPFSIPTPNFRYFLHSHESP
jgi:hypothetical protein